MKQKSRDISFDSLYVQLEEVLSDVTLHILIIAEYLYASVENLVCIEYIYVQSNGIQWRGEIYWSECWTKSKRPKIFTFGSMCLCNQISSSFYGLTFFSDTTEDTGSHFNEQTKQLLLCLPLYLNDSFVQLLSTRAF